MAIHAVAYQRLEILPPHVLEEVQTGGGNQIVAVAFRLDEAQNGGEELDLDKVTIGELIVARQAVLKEA